MDQRSDFELVEEVRRGNRRAFTELMRRHQQSVYRVVRRIVGDHMEADDITQETFVKAYLGLGDFRGDAGFFTWLYRIGVNLSLNAVKKRRVLDYLRQSDLLSRLLPAAPGPDEELSGRETEMLLKKAVAALPEKQRVVFIMRYFEEMSYDEIAQILKTSVGGLKANYFHAVRKIRESLKNDIPEPG
ncbi:MAG: sigma-70 family RNA polymerase sigma factor [Bacteroidota bacterium]